MNGTLIGEAVWEQFVHKSGSMPLSAILLSWRLMLYAFCIALALAKVVMEQVIKLHQHSTIHEVSCYYRRTNAVSVVIVGAVAIAHMLALHGHVVPSGNALQNPK